MTPKEKAKGLFEKFSDTTMAYDSGDHTAEGINETLMVMVSESKRCALICAEEVIREIPMYTGNLNPRWEYWNDVTIEINNL